MRRSLKKLELFAICAPGLERILAAELVRLGVRPGELIPGGVAFAGSLSDMRRVNLWSRVASRVLVRLAEFHASSFHELERRSAKVPWSRYLRDGQPVRFRVTSRKSRLYHSDAVAERLARAAAGKSGSAPAGTHKGADGDEEDDATDAQLFIVRIANDVCTVSADTSGALLHRRGYRQAVARAPLRETLAAAVLLGSGWDGSSPLVDPLCGSGTIPIEAALIARNIAPGIRRSFAFERWPSPDADQWSSERRKAEQEELPASPVLIAGSDRDTGAIEASLGNAERAGVDGDIRFDVRSLSAAEFPDGAGLLATNPPYGVRVGESPQLRNLYAQLGKVLTRASDYKVALLSAERKLETQLRVSLREVFRTTNGGIPVRLLTGPADE